MNCQQNQGFRFFQGRSKTETPKATKRAPREAKMSPRSCSGGPKSSPRGPKTVPRAARSAPRGAQEQPGAHQKGPKRGPGRPRAAKRPFGRPPGPILASFWGALGFIFKQLRRPFRSSRALRQTIENTLRNHWSKGLVLAWPAFGGRKRNHDEGFTFFSGQSEIRDSRSDLRAPGAGRRWARPPSQGFRRAYMRGR